MLIFVVIKQKGSNYSIFFCHSHKIPQIIETQPDLLTKEAVWQTRHMGAHLVLLVGDQDQPFCFCFSDQTCLIAYTMRKNVNSIKTNLSTLSSPSS